MVEVMQEWEREMKKHEAKERQWEAEREKSREVVATRSTLPVLRVSQ